MCTSKIKRILRGMTLKFGIFDVPNLNKDWAQKKIGCLQIYEISTAQLSREFFFLHIWSSE